MNVNKSEYCCRYELVREGVIMIISMVYDFNRLASKPGVMYRLN